ncbi:MAG: tetratricopeptide repeat protein [Planctomycetes bacterium]|nr:tetratricopeptide repeat protein [Planctomycetota bacterium]
MVVDLDLEAPGLPFKLGFGSSSAVGEGVVGLLRRFCAGQAPPASLRDWVHVVPGQEQVHLLPAGPAHVAQYWRDLTALDWDSLFRGSDPQGVRFFTWLREAIERDLSPDHLLVDARTGITAMGGAAVSLLADQVVALVGTSLESQHGTREVLRAIKVAPRLAGRSEPVRIGVVLARLPGLLYAEEVQTFRRTVRSFLVQEADPLSATLSVELPMVVRSEQALERDERAVVGSSGLAVFGDYDVVTAWLEGRVVPEAVPARFFSIATKFSLMQGQVEQAREMAERDPAGELPTLATSLRNLARAFAEAGRHDDALKAVDEATALYRRLASERPQAFGVDLASSLQEMANLLFGQSRQGEAERAYREAVAVSAQFHGTRTHVALAGPLAGLAAALTIQGRFQEAEQCYRESIDVLSRAPGTVTQGALAASFLGLGNVLFGQRRFSEAEQAFRESAVINARVHGRVHPSVAASVHNLANALACQHRYSEAAESYREAIALGEGIFGTRKGVAVLEALYGLARVLGSHGSHSEAEQTYREILSIGADLFGKRNTPGSIPALVELATILLRTGRESEAEDLARDAWAGALECDDPIQAVQAGRVLVAVLTALQRHDEAGAIDSAVAQRLARLPSGYRFAAGSSQQPAGLAPPPSGLWGLAPKPHPP